MPENVSIRPSRSVIGNFSKTQFAASSGLGELRPSAAIFKNSALVYAIPLPAKSKSFVVSKSKFLLSAAARLAKSPCPVL